jgi:hypothetical protein
MALGRPARLETKCFATGQPVTVDITPAPRPPPAGSLSGPGAKIYPLAEEFDRCRWLAADMGWL